MNEFIGRERELLLLDEIYSSKEPEFLAVYGRRRVGKTLLIRQFFKNKDAIYMEVTGVKDGKLNDQLQNFIDSFSEVFSSSLPLARPKNWRLAFDLLTQTIKTLSKKKKVILFLDEIPWLSTRRSGLLQQIDYFWNRHWNQIPNFKFIVCGSAASWVLDNIINAKGGLYNRITLTMLLKPFTLTEAKKFLRSRNIKYNENQILDVYIVTGGIPHYLKQFKRSKSVIQNINDICFTKDGLLYGEFEKLFQSLFSNNEFYQAVIALIANSSGGINLTNLSQKLNLKKGGRIVKKLQELEDSGFIKKFIPLGRNSRDGVYKIVDEYTLFYLKWIQQFVNRNESPGDNQFWHLTSKSPSWYSWAGYAFERICFKHSGKIAKAIGINAINYRVCDWRHISQKKSNEVGAQIDILFDRDDGVITICEVKYKKGIVAVDKKLAKQLAQKLQVFEQMHKTDKQINLCLITTLGIKKSIWSDDLIDHQVIAEKLF